MQNYNNSPNGLMWNVFIFNIFEVKIHHTFATRKLGAPSLKKEAENHREDQSHPCVLEELGSKC